MVRTLNISLDEKEYKDAQKKKGGRTWKQVLMDGLEKQGNQA
jgi:hypothetical protein